MLGVCDMGGHGEGGQRDSKTSGHEMEGQKDPRPTSAHNEATCLEYSNTRNLAWSQISHLCVPEVG